MFYLDDYLIRRDDEGEEVARVINAETMHVLGGMFGSYRLHLYKRCIQGK